jgi:putative tricarboxylic transport membrane protein
MYIGNVMLLILNLPLVPLFAQILRVPYYVLYPGILGVSIVGVYTVDNSLFDVWMLALFGLLGYFMRKLDYPSAPLVLGMVLGQRLELALRQSLMMSQGQLSILVASPLAMGMLFCAGILLLVPTLNWVRSWRAKAIEQEV